MLFHECIKVTPMLHQSGMKGHEVVCKSHTSAIAFHGSSMTFAENPHACERENTDGMGALCVDPDRGRRCHGSTRTRVGDKSVGYRRATGAISASPRSARDMCSKLKRSDTTAVVFFRDRCQIGSIRVPRRRRKPWNGQGFRQLSHKHAFQPLW